MSTAKQKPQQQLDPLACFHSLKDDIRAMEWDCLANDKRTILVAKADVLAIIDEWIAYVFEETVDALSKPKAGKK